MNANEAISIKEYARRKGCSDTAVRKAIAAGKIVNGVIDQGTPRPKILPTIADAEWSVNFNPSYERNQNLASNLMGTAAPPPVKAPAKPPQKPTADTEDAAPPPPPPTVPGSGKSLAELKRLTAEVRLQTEALNLRAKKGQLVDKDKVYNALFAIGQEVKSAILTLPDRYIDAIYSAPSRNEAHTVLYAALNEALEGLSNIGTRNITGDGD